MKTNHRKQFSDRVRTAGCLLFALMMLFSAAVAEGRPAGKNTPENPMQALLHDLRIGASPEKLEEDTEAAGNDLAPFLVKVWKETYLNPEFRVYLNGREDPAELEISGRHAFVILGFQLQDGKMADELKARCDAAAAAAKEFPDSLLICTGGATGKNNPERHTEAGLMKEYLVNACGISAERILTDEKAMTTEENAVNTFLLLQEHGIETITPVTSSYHQVRATLLYRVTAELFRQTTGRTVRVIGNFGCEAEASGFYVVSDRSIATSQIMGIMKASASFLPFPG